MIKYFVMVCLSFVLLFGKDYHKEIRSLNTDQYYVMLNILELGKQDDLSYTLAAIAWKESMFGKFPINATDGKLGSYGAFHILLEYSVKRNQIESSWETSRLAEKHLFDLEFNTNEAIQVLKGFTKRVGCDLDCAIASYNAGNKGLNSKRGLKYLQDIKQRREALKNFIVMSNEQYFLTWHTQVTGL